MNGIDSAINRTFYTLGLKTPPENENTVTRVSKPVIWGMNPVDRWCEKASIRGKMDGFYDSAVEKYSKWDIPMEKIQYVYENGYAQDKAMCITVFAALDEFEYVIG